MSDNLRIKLEPMDEETRHLYDGNSDTTDNDEDVKPLFITTPTIVLSSDDDNNETNPFRVRNTRSTSSRLVRKPNKVIILSEVGTQTEETTTRAVETSTDDVAKAELGVNTDPVPEKSEIAVNTEPIPTTAEFGVGVNEDMLTKVDESEDMDVDDVEHSNELETSRNQATSSSKEIYYQCSICSCYYLSIHKLHKHSQEQHNKAISSDHPKVSYTPKCKFCSSVYVFVTYNKHIKQKHTDIFTSKKKNSRKLDLSGPYECIVCKLKFLTYNDGKRHRKAHTDIAQKSILRKLKDDRSNEGVASSSTVRVEKLASPILRRPVPKSFLFQCPKCELNFFTYRNGLRHKIACVKGDIIRGIIVNCAKCDKKFLSVHIKAHDQQHQMSNEFQIQPIVDGIEHKIIYRCMKCKNCMEERGSRLHFQSGCGISLGIPCTLCNLKIEKDFMQKHKEAHSRLGLTKEDIILVDICD